LNEQQHEITVEDLKGFPDVIARDHMNADYSKSRDNYIEYDVEEDKVVIEAESDSSLKALYD